IFAPSSVSWCRSTRHPSADRRRRGHRRARRYSARSALWPVEFGREESRCGLQDRVGPLELGVLPPQPLQLRRLLSRHPGPLTGVDLGLAAPLPDSLRRPDTEQLGDLAHRSPLRLVIGPDLGDHPDRPLTQLGRVPPRRTPWHDSILPKERSLRTCRGGSHLGLTTILERDYDEAISL